MIVSLTELKEMLGLDQDATDEDAKLTRLINAATTTFEGKTRRRFREPIMVTEYRDGDDNRVLYLRGHIDDENAADSGSDDPALSLIVSRRARMLATAEWEVLTIDEDYERRKDTLRFLRAWRVWTCEDEFKIEYLDGYFVAPEDVHAAILEMAMNQYLSDIASSSGTAGITSEKLGDYSYTVDLGAIGSSGGTSGALSDTTKDTIQRYKRRFV